MRAFEYKIGETIEINKVDRMKRLKRIAADNSTFAQICKP